jgi:hypothetical protein
MLVKTLSPSFERNSCHAAKSTDPHSFRRSRRGNGWRSERSAAGSEWVRGCLSEGVGITAGVPQTAADLLRRQSRPGRANYATCRSGICHTGLI